MPDALYERYKDALRRGHVAALRDRPDMALAAYLEAAAIAPDRALPHVSMAGVLARSGRHEEALAAYGAALSRAPRDEAALAGRAEALAALGRRTEAATVLDGLAEVQEAGGRLAAACDTCRRSLELAESKARRRQLRRLTQRLSEQGGEDAAAEAVLGAAVRLLELTEPALPGAEGVQAGEAEPGAEPEAAEAPEAPADPYELLATAAAALDAGDEAAARSALVAAASAFGTTGRPNAALDACYQALALDPANPDVHLALVALYLERGWDQLAAEKLGLLGRLAALAGDDGARARVCEIVAARFPADARLAALCA